MFLVHLIIPILKFLRIIKSIYEKKHISCFEPIFTCFSIIYDHYSRIYIGCPSINFSVIHRPLPPHTLPLSSNHRFCTKRSTTLPAFQKLFHSTWRCTATPIRKYVSYPSSSFFEVHPTSLHPLNLPFLFAKDHSRRNHQCMIDTVSFTIILVPFIQSVTTTITILTTFVRLPSPPYQP